MVCAADDKIVSRDEGEASCNSASATSRRGFEEDGMRL